MSDASLLDWATWHYITDRILIWIGPLATVFIALYARKPLKEWHLNQDLDRKNRIGDVCAETLNVLDRVMEVITALDENPSPENYRQKIEEAMPQVVNIGWSNLSEYQKQGTLFWFKMIVERGEEFQYLKKLKIKAQTDSALRETDMILIIEDLQNVIHFLRDAALRIAKEGDREDCLELGCPDISNMARMLDDEETFLQETVSSPATDTDARAKERQGLRLPYRRLHSIKPRVEKILEGIYPGN